MATLTEDDLARMAAALGLRLDREEIRALLPEVERILTAAQRLRELPLDPGRPPFRAESP